MKSKNTALKLMMITLVILGLGINGYTFIKSNGSGRGYDDDDGGRIAYTNTIEYYVIVGAGHYLKASAAVQQMLNLYEMQDVEGLDKEALESAAVSAISHMANAIETYDQLIQKAEATPYNIVVIDKLKNLDYTAFKDKYQLNDTVVMRVKDFLSKGNITGMYKQTRAEYSQMLELLLTMNSDLQQGSVPGISAFWQLNERMSESAIFGSYVARVFTEIQK